MTVTFPAASYYIASSRLRPGMDGGYTVATLRRAAQFEKYAGITPVLLTFDFWPDYDQVVDEFRALGLMTDTTVVRNLLGDVRRSPDILRDGAVPLSADPHQIAAIRAHEQTPDATRVELDSRGTPWRLLSTDAHGAPEHTDYFDDHGQLLLRVPYISGRADWHRAPVVMTVFDTHGAPSGTLTGFDALYRAWLAAVFAADNQTLLVCESRQVGELLAGWPMPHLRIVHTVHSAHTAAPYEWDSPVDGLWASWFDTVPHYDAVLWLTDRQKRAVERRFGVSERNRVVPHAVELEPLTGERDPDLIVTIGRLSPLKQFDHTIRAFDQVRDRHPKARLELFGDGPDEPRLEALIADLGLTDRAMLQGHRSDAADVLHRASAIVLTSRYEGHPLVLLEALARGCPVIAYDINYGPDETVIDTVTGYLVAPDSIDGVADALDLILSDPNRVGALSQAAREWTAEHSPERSMLLTAAVFNDVLTGTIGNGAARS